MPWIFNLTLKNLVCQFLLTETVQTSTFLFIMKLMYLDNLTLAHVKWFVSSPKLSAEPTVQLFEAIWLILFILAGVFTLFLANQLLNKTKITSRLDRLFFPMQKWIPTVLRLSLGVSLFITGLQGHFFAPNINLPADPYSTFNSVQIILGTCLILGLATSLVAILVLVTYLGGFFLVKPPDLLDHLEIVGYSLSLLLLGAGKWGLDSFIFKVTFGLEKWARLAPRLLLFFVGLALISAAGSEKIFAVSLSQDFLSYHNWNFLSLAGVSNRNFIFFIAGSEIIIGLALIFNLALRLIVVSLLAMMSLTAFLLGPTEVWGHLFAIGVVFTSLVGWKEKTSPD